MIQLVMLDKLVNDGVISLQTGPFGSQLHSYDYIESGVPVVSTEGIKEGRIDHSVLPRISEEKAVELVRHRLKVNDVLFARRGAQATGRTARIRDSEAGFLCGTGAIRARIEDISVVDPEYFSWFLAAPETVLWIREQAIGATMPNLNESIIKRIRLPLPPLKKQQEIAAVLGTIDDKIELNHKMAATLEAIARALYQSWFVDFDPVHARSQGLAPAQLNEVTAALFPNSFGSDGLPEGWAMGTLADIAINSQTVVKPDQIDPSTPYIGLEHMPRKSIALSDWGVAEQISSQKSVMRSGDFLFGKLRPYFHKVGVSPVDGICSTDIIVVRPKSSIWAAMVLSVISSEKFIEHTNSSSTGTRMPRTNWKDMARYEVVLPPEDIAQVFDDMTRPMRDQITQGIHENKTLATLRDTLLPRLMSGELRVGDAREQVEEML